MLEQNRKELRNPAGSKCLWSPEAYFISLFLLYVMSTEIVSDNPSHIRSYACPRGQCFSNFLAPRTPYKISQKFFPASSQKHVT